MTEKMDPYREAGKQKIYLELPENSSVGQVCPEFTASLRATNFEARHIVIKSDSLGSLPFKQLDMSEGINYYRFEQPTEEGRSVLIDTKTGNMDGYPNIIIAFDIKTNTATIHSIFTKGHNLGWAERDLDQTKEAGKRFALIEEWVSKFNYEIEAGKIKLALRLPKDISTGSSLMESINDIKNIQGMENIRQFEQVGANETVFYSTATGILRYQGREPELNKKHSIYNYISEKNPNIKLSIILDRTKKGSERLTIINLAGV